MFLDKTKSKAGRIDLPCFLRFGFYWFGTTAKNSNGPSLSLIRAWERPLGQ